jgi:hypothetical protein
MLNLLHAGYGSGTVPARSLAGKMVVCAVVESGTGWTLRERKWGWTEPERAAGINGC